MIKKVLSVLLAVCLLLGCLPLGVSAEEKAPDVEGTKAIDLTAKDMPIQKINFDPPLAIVGGPDGYDPTEGDEGTFRGGLGEEITEGYAITTDTEFTLKNVGTDKTAYIYVCFSEYVKCPANSGFLVEMGTGKKIRPLEGLYAPLNGSRVLVNASDHNDGVRSDTPTMRNGLTWRQYWREEGWRNYSALIKLYPGESTSFTLPESQFNRPGSQWKGFYQMNIVVHYPNIPWFSTSYYNLIFDKDLAAGGNKPNPDPELPTQFADVPASAYYADAVKWAVDNGITAGTDKTHFSPNASCTRAQAVTFLWRAAGEPEPQNTNMKFNDVKAGSYYEKAVQWAVENGVTAGTGETTFSPNATCTRAQIVTFLYRAENSPEIIGNNSFNDVKTGAYYENAVKWAVENNITSGTGGNKFSPDNNCIRGQIVTFLYRYSK